MTGCSLDARPVPRFKLRDVSWSLGITTAFVNGFSVHICLWLRKLGLIEFVTHLRSHKQCVIESGINSGKHLPPDQDP